MNLKESINFLNTERITGIKVESNGTNKKKQICDG